MTKYEIEKLKELRDKVNEFTENFNEQEFGSFMDINRDFNKSTRLLHREFDPSADRWYSVYDAERLYNNLCGDYGLIPNITLIEKLIGHISEGKIHIEQDKIETHPTALLIKEIIGTYADEISFEKAIVGEYINISDESLFAGKYFEPITHLKAIVNQLEIFLDKVCNGRNKNSVEQLHSGLNVQITNQNNNHIEIKIDIVNTLEAVQKIEGLNDAERLELNRILLEIEKLKTSKDKTSLWAKIKSASLWVLDKGIDVTIAVMPYLLASAK